MSTELVEKLRDYAGDDHERLCQGRNYDCTCGYDERRDPLIEAAADELTALTAKVALLTEALKGLDAPWVQFISCWNDPSGDAEYDAEEEKDNVKVLADAMLAARRALSEPDKEGT